MQFKLKMQLLVYDNDQVTTFGDTMMIEDSSIVMILKSGLHTMMIKDKKIGDIIILPHPDPPSPARIIRARKGSNIRSSGVLSIKMLNLQDTKQDSMHDDQDRTMLEDTKRVDTLTD